MSASSGDIDARKRPGQGLFFHDTRFLDRFVITVNGSKLINERTEVHRGRGARVQLVSPADQHDGRLLPRGAIRVTRVRSLAHDLREAVLIRNCGSEAISIELAIVLSADFDHVLDLRSPERAPPGKVTSRWKQHHLNFCYEGADGRTRNTTVSFGPQPHSEGRMARYRWRLEPDQLRRISIRVFLSDLGPGDLEIVPPAPPAVPTVRGTQLESDNARFNRVIQQAFDDLQMLSTRQQGESFFAAGVPWFVALFGRDSLLTAMELLAYQPSFARDTLRLLARYQGREHDPWRDEEPGKIPHELRTGEKANLAEVPHSRYYGTVDATPLFIVLLGEYLRWTGDVALAKELFPCVERALRWIQAADHDGDGFVDYVRRAPEGLENQGWKDSWNGIRHRDGSIAEPPIALVEVQGYVYAAKRTAARLYRLIGNEMHARRLETEAALLRDAFQQRFWMPERGTFALAIARDGRRVESSTSNPGHALWSGIVEAAPARRLARTLMGETLFSGWGIRTLADNEAAYDADDYQVGAVWPHDNAIILAGFRRYGFDPDAARLFDSMFATACALPDGRLPELFAGYSSRERPTPVAYPEACVPQAWAAGALPFMVQAMLGLEPRAEEHELRIVNPILPAALRSLVVRNLRVGEGSADLHFLRRESTTRVVILKTKGTLRVRVVPASIS